MKRDNLCIKDNEMFNEEDFYSNEDLSINMDNEHISHNTSSFFDISYDISAEINNHIHNTNLNKQAKQQQPEMPKGLNHYEKEIASNFIDRT